MCDIFLDFSSQNHIFYISSQASYLNKMVYVYFTPCLDFQSFKNVIFL